MAELQSNAATLGIKLNLASKPANAMGAIAGGNCVVAGLPCDWDMANMG
jgi:hypothetical protein